ncbi:hypothetical protein SAFG77S_09965 [Streptomyces afghaniensis]
MRSCTEKRRANSRTSLVSLDRDRPFDDLADPAVRTAVALADQPYDRRGTVHLHGLIVHAQPRDVPSRLAEVGRFHYRPIRARALREFTTLPEQHNELSCRSVHALEFDASAVLTLCEEDPVLGQTITRCVSAPSCQVCGGTSHGQPSNSPWPMALTVAARRPGTSVFHAPRTVSCPGTWSRPPEGRDQGLRLWRSAAAAPRRAAARLSGEPVRPHSERRLEHQECGTHQAVGGLCRSANTRRPPGGGCGPLTFRRGWSDRQALVRAADEQQEASSCSFRLARGRSGASCIP